MDTMSKILSESKKFIRGLICEHVDLNQPSYTTFNQSVNFDKKIIFIAVPKTGTTTVRRQIREPGNAFISNAHMNIQQIRDALYVYCLSCSLGGNHDFPTHQVVADSDIRAQAKAIFDSFFKFSAVRNPWARAVSLYFRREGVQVQEHCSFESFCDQHLYASDTCIHPTLHKNQLDWLCDEEGNCMLDYVYKIEDFALAIKEIDRRTQGRLKLINQASNSNPKSMSANYRDMYTARTRDLIARRFERDIDYFKYVF